MIGTTGSKWGTREKSRTSAKGASVERVHRKVSFNDVDSTMIDRFHQQVYQHARAYTISQGSTGRDVVGQETAERQKIKQAIEAFASKVAKYTERFLLREQVQQCDDLILTGGGCFIPQVQQAIGNALKQFNLANTYMPTDKATGRTAGMSPLSNLLVRGATALGGASVLFDY